MCDRPAMGPAGASIFLLGRLIGLARLERGAQDIAERGTRVGGSELSDGFLLLRNLECLDRHRDLAGLAVELRPPPIDLLPDREALRPLLGALTRELPALDEGRQVGADDLHVDPRLL